MNLIPYLLLIRLLPRWLRDRAGAEMIELHREAVEHARAKGRVAAIGTVAREWTDLLMVIASAWWSGDGGARRGIRSFLEPDSPLLESIRADCRLALRGLGRQPSFTLAAVGTLALGIGGVTTMWSVVNGVLLKPLPYAEEDRLVSIWIKPEPNAPDTGRRGPRMWLSNRDYPEVLASSRTLEDVAGLFGNWGRVELGDRAEDGDLAFVTANFFSLLGIEMEKGRGFLPGEDDVGPGWGGGAPVAVLAHETAVSLFGNADPIGQFVDMVASTGVRTPHRVVGVTAPGFRILMDLEYEIWIPREMTAMPPNPDGSLPMDRNLSLVVGRTWPGVKLPEVREDVGRLLVSWTPQERELQATEPKSRFVGVELLRQTVNGKIDDALWLAFAAAALVLFVGCINVAHLVASRITDRESELAGRRALGATAARLFRQLTTEAAVIASIGALLGLAIAAASVRAIAAYGPNAVTAGDDQIGIAVPRLADVRLDLRALAICASVSLLCVLLAGLAPALRAMWGDLPRSGPIRKANAAPSRMRRRGVLLAVQLTVAVTLVASAGVLLRSLERRLAIEPGLDPRGLVVAEVVLPAPEYVADSTAWWLFLKATVATLEADPRVASAATSTAMGHLSGVYQSGRVPRLRMEDQTEEQRPRGVHPWIRASPEYFSTLGISLVDGRGFTSDDTLGATPIAVVNESMARLYWPKGDAVGRRFWKTPTELLTVVGVVTDAYEQTATAVSPLVYTPLAQIPGWESRVEFGVFVRAGDGDVATLMPDWQGACFVACARAFPLLADVVHSLEPRAVVMRLSPWETSVESDLRSPRFLAAIFASFAALACTIAAAGVFGVIGYVAGQRQQEIGVRIALGGAPGRVALRALGPTLGFAATGLIVGVGVALGSSRLLEGWLFETAAADPLSLSGAGLTLIGAAAVGAWIPIRRALSVDPSANLKA